MNDSNATTELQGVEGIVKWFDPRKGFGFIVGPEEQDIFVHYSQIEGDGFRVLKDGTKVLYDAEHTERGWHATRVAHLEEPEIEVRKIAPAARNPRRVK
jgi:CspA family cold shock protein